VLAVARRAEHVTVELGGNDVCGLAGGPAGRTPVPPFRRQLDAGLSRLTAGLPGARIFLGSLDDLTAEWQVLHQARVRGFALPCGLGPGSPPSLLTAVKSRIRALNTVLAAACARYPACRYDGGAVFRMRWRVANLSRYDYGHLSLAGERELAAVTWAATYPFGR
jgi:hypothetical protein